MKLIFNVFTYSLICTLAFSSQLLASKKDSTKANQNKNKSIQVKGSKKMEKWSQFQKPSDKELKTSLSKTVYQVTQKDGTEPPFKNQYWDNKEEGIYVDAISGEPLFSSKDKFDSGTGWPSFTKPIDTQFIKTKKDFKLILPRTEVRSRYADSHLGHVFKDGPKESTGLRYCINSAALKFIPVSQLKEKGYGDYLELFK